MKNFATVIGQCDINSIFDKNSVTYIEWWQVYLREKRNLGSRRLDVLSATGTFYDRPRQNNDLWENPSITKEYHQYKSFSPF